jgi:hypothetical protein
MYGYVKRDILKWVYRLVVDWKSESDDQVTDSHSGSGFFIGCGSAAHLVTNRHLVDCKYEKARTKTLSKISVFGLDPSGNKFECWANAEDLNIRYSPNNAEDVALVAVPNYWNVVGGDQLCWIHKEWHVYDDSFSRDIELCDLLTIPGFPLYFDRQSDKPIARMGTIASDPDDDYRGPGQSAARRVAYEAFSTSGNSGGPVLALSRGHPTDLRPGVPQYRPARLLGVNAGHFQNTETKSHEGVSYFFRMQVVKDICDAAGLSID